MLINSVYKRRGDGTLINQQISLNVDVWVIKRRQFTAMLHFKLVAVLMLASVAHFQTTDRPSWYEGCVNTKECASTECCVLGGLAYSIAGCNSLLGAGEACRPNNEPMNATVGYPNGDKVHLTDVYYILCNCAQGLTCVQGTCVKDDADVKPQL